MSKAVYRIALPSHGNRDRGYLTPYEACPFPIKRIYWIQGVPEHAQRGGHAHRRTQQVFFCLQGRCHFTARDARTGDIGKMSLSPSDGLYIGPMVWHWMEDFARGTVLLALASTKYNEADYIRDYNEWNRLVGK